VSLEGRQREFAAFVCSRSAAVGTRSPVTLKCPPWWNDDLLDKVGERQVPRWTGRREDRHGQLSAAAVIRQAEAD
jgi:hypothetical protein